MHGPGGGEGVGRNPHFPGSRHLQTAVLGTIDEETSWTKPPLYGTTDGWLSYCHPV